MHKFFNIWLPVTKKRYVSLPHRAVRWSAVCDGVVSWLCFLLFNAIGLSLFNEKWREKEIIEKYKSKQQQKQIKIYPALTASTVDRHNAQIPKSRILDILRVLRTVDATQWMQFFPGSICTCTRRGPLSVLRSFYSRHHTLYVGIEHVA